MADVDDETLGYKVGAELIKQAANKMNDVAGDGTTTVTVLTYHILNEANKLIAAGHNPMLLRKGLEAAAQDVMTKLGGMAEDIKGNKTARGRSRHYLGRRRRDRQLDRRCHRQSRQRRRRDRRRRPGSCTGKRSRRRLYL